MNTDSTAARRGISPIVWASSAAAALLLVLGVTGTLSSWTQAILTNDTNTATATTAVALSETSSGGVLCRDTATSTDNTATCSTINKYSGNTLDPDGTNSATTTVTMKNTGTKSGALTLAPGACSKSGGPTGSAGNICDNLTVKVECPTGTSKVATQTLNAFYTASNSSTGTPVAIGTLAAGATVSCAFTVTLPTATPSNVSGMTASQALVWKLA